MLVFDWIDLKYDYFVDNLEFITHIAVSCVSVLSTGVTDSKTATSRSHKITNTAFSDWELDRRRPSDKSPSKIKLEPNWSRLEWGLPSGKTTGPLEKGTLSLCIMIRRLHCFVDDELWKGASKESCESTIVCKCRCVGAVPKRHCDKAHEKWSSQAGIHSVGESTLNVF